MKKILFVCFSLCAVFVFSANLQAQIGVSDNNFNLKFNAFGDNANFALTRPRIVKEKSIKTENTESIKTEIAKADVVSAIPVAPAAIGFELEKKAFALLNAKRLEMGLSALNWSDDVAKIARVHSQNMASYKFFSHTGLDGYMVSDRADKLGIRKWSAIGENIAYNRGYQNPVEFAVERWMLSNSHRENLLSNRWKESGVGVAITADGTYYFTQVFLVRK